MIFDTMDNICKYFDELPLLKKVSEFVDDFYKNDLPDGTYKIDGERVFAMVQSFSTKPQTSESRFGAHRKYIDLQYIVSGIEKIRCSDLDKVELTEERYSSGGDIAFYKGEAMQDFTLTKNAFLLLFPSDAHMPRLSVLKDVDVRKIVFKIMV